MHKVTLALSTCSLNDLSVGAAGSGQTGAGDGTRRLHFYKKNPVQCKYYIEAFILFGCAPIEHSIYIIYFMLIIYDDETR